MSTSTETMLTEQVDSVAETVREYARQIESGEYGNQWTATDDEGNTADIVADDRDDAIYHGALSLQVPEYEVSVEHIQLDEPTVEETPISEWPLSVEVKIGRPLAVVISTGGPHIEIAQELGAGGAKLAGYWGGEKVYRHGDVFQTVLDYFTDDLYDQAPEEYK